MGPYSSWKKYCRHCKRFLLDLFFRPSQLRQPGISSVCRVCSREKHAEYYKIHHERYKARNVANREKKNGIKKSWVKAPKVKVVVNVGDLECIVLKF